MAKKYPKLSDTLKRLLFEKNMKPIDLAREVDMPQPTIHRLVTGKSTRPYRRSLKPIADFFDISVDQLLGEQPIVAWQGDEPQASLPSPDQVKLVPVIGWGHVVDHDIQQVQAEAKRHVAVVGAQSDKLFAVVMNDYSMELMFAPGTVLIFDPEMTAKDRCFVLVKLAGKSTPIFRQLLVDVDHQYLKPLNTDLERYKMRLLEPEDEIIACLLESRISHEPFDERLLEMDDEIK